MRITRAIAAAALLGSTPPALAADHETGADEPRVLTEDDLKSLKWREIGPANMGGRVSALALSEADPRVLYVGYATGGVWKTTNHGTTFRPIFDGTGMNCIGAIAIADVAADWDGWDEGATAEERAEQGAGRVVWVGTGEGNGRNSSSWGGGVYRSTNGGGKFELVGLEDTHDIPAMALDPRDPDVCYVAALGHLWGANEQRGVYKTADGGETWDHVLNIDENTGACDVLVSPDDPDTVYAAMYDRRRSPWSFRSGGDEGGIYRSTDAGRTWKKLTEGLPSKTGRIGLAICPSSSNVLYAQVESAEDGHLGGAIEDRSRGGGFFRTDDGGDTWTRTSDFMSRPFYFSRTAVDPVDCDRVYLPGFNIAISDDAGDTFYNFGKMPHVDYHAMIVDPNDADHLLVGNDGGFYRSWDRGETWDYYREMAVGQFYNIDVDDSTPYRIAGGLQDNGSWIGVGETVRNASGNSFMGRGGALTTKHWDFVMGGDGFMVRFDPTDPDTVYATSQGGNLARVNLRTGQTRSLKPGSKEGERAFRFNWNAPFFVSPHDPTVLYHGGNRVFRLEERGDRWAAISPDLTTNDIDKVITVGSQAETYGTIVSLAESHVEQGLLWAGTDDGLIHVTSDGGETWDDVTPDIVGGMYITSIEPSKFNADTAYASVSGHRMDERWPIVIVTNDRGMNWELIVGGLPEDAVVDVVREDPRNPAVLYAGTERAMYVSITYGGLWVKLNSGELPPVKVDDIAIQPREMDLLAGTHGRSVWVLDDIRALSALTPEIVESDLHVFEIGAVQPRQRLGTYEFTSDRQYVADNPSRDAAIHYWVRDEHDGGSKITIRDAHGRTIRSLSGKAKPGLNTVTWDMQADSKIRLSRLHPGRNYTYPGAYTVNVKVGEHEREMEFELLPELGGSPHQVRDSE